MFGNAKKTIEETKKSLEKKYQQLLEESFHLSHSDRKKSDLKRAEAEEISVQLDALEKSKEGEQRV